MDFFGRKRRKAQTRRIACRPRRGQIRRNLRDERCEFCLCHGPVGARGPGPNDEFGYQLIGEDESIPEERQRCECTACGPDDTVCRHMINLNEIGSSFRTLDDKIVCAPCAARRFTIPILEIPEFLPLMRADSNTEIDDDDDHLDNNGDA